MPDNPLNLSDDMPKLALFLTVGTTAEPIIKSIDEALKETADLEVHLIYGRPFPGQCPNPLDIVTEVKQKAQQLGANKIMTYEISNPEDVEAAIATCREAVRNAVNVEKVMANFTCGTKPMSAALVHSVITEPLNCEVILDYVGGIARNSAGRVISGNMELKTAPKTYIQESMRNVLDLLKTYSYSRALTLMNNFPKDGRAGFLKSATSALYLWDCFNYEIAFEELKKLREQAKVMKDDKQFGTMSQTILRLSEYAYGIVRAIEILRKLENNQAKPTELSGDAVENSSYLIADALENGQRRLKEGRYEDAVLRFYKAVENTVQIALILRKINPWHPSYGETGESVCQNFLSKIEQISLPNTLALYTGLAFLEVLNGQDFDQTLKDKLRCLQRIRNYSMLEHGFEKVSEESAKTAFKNAYEICCAVTRQDLSIKMSNLRHEFLIPDG